MQAGSIGSTAVTGYYLQSSARNEQARQPAQKQSAGTDSVEISTEGLALSKTQSRLKDIGSLLPDYDNDGVITGEELRTQLRGEVQSFREMIDSVLSLAGVEDPEKVVLGLDMQGQVVVESCNEADREKTEQALDENPDLRDSLAKISAISSLLRAAAEAVEFQKAYAQDPNAAVDRYSYLFNDSYQPDFHFSLAGDRGSIYFTSLIGPSRQEVEF